MLIPRNSAAKQPSIAEIDYSERTSPLSAQLPWLLNSPTDHVWHVRDSDNLEVIVEIDFAVRMHRGTLLDYPEFLQLAKEYCALLRDSRFTKVRTAETQKTMMGQLFAILQRLVYDGYRSLKKLTKYHLKAIIDVLHLGRDELILASVRVDKWLRPDGKTLRKVLPTSETNRGRLATDTILKAVGLSTSAAHLPKVAALFRAAAEERGLTLTATNGSRGSAEANGERLSSQALMAYYRTFELLYAMRGSLTVPSIIANPFTTNASAMAKRRGRAGEVTPCPPAKLALHLISEAMVMVRDHSAAILELIEDMSAVGSRHRVEHIGFTAHVEERLERFRAALPQGKRWDGVTNKVWTQEGLASISRVVKHLFTACFIILATFSARRNDEILGLLEGECREVDGFWEMYYFIGKTLRRKDWIPAPKIAADAFDVLRRLSAAARKFTDSEGIFRWMSPFYLKITLMDAPITPRSIDEFAEWVEVPKHVRDGKEETWHWHPHQFRKFFAILYFYRYKGATVEVLAQFLRHYNLNMTLHYLTLRPEDKANFDQVANLVFRDKAASIVRSAEQSRGTPLTADAKAQRVSIIKVLQKSVTVTGPSFEKKCDAVERQMTRRKIVIFPNPWADCMCPRTASSTAAAACRKDSAMPKSQFGPDHSNTNATMCNGCQFSDSNQNMQRYIDDESQAMEALCESDFGGNSVLGRSLGETNVFRAVRIVPKAAA